MVELVAWKSYRYQSTLLILLVQLLKPLELWREATLASGVDNEQHLSLELSEVQFLTSARQGFKVINCIHNIENKKTS